MEQAAMLMSVVDDAKNDSIQIMASRDLTAVDGGLSSLQVKIFRIYTSAVLRILLILPV